MIERSDITGLVLAGGRGTRMGGVDKGLQDFRGTPLALHALQRLQRQTGAALLNANRHLDRYAAFGVPVWPDAVEGYPGPLAGFLAGLTNAATPWVLTVPCDTPLFPQDLAARLAHAADREAADIAMAAAYEDDGSGTAPVLRPQPVFCLLRTALREDLADHIAAGGSKVRAWAMQQRCALVPFDQPGDAPDAFSNANTLAELQTLQTPRGGMP